jgi:hypothetical protein
VAACSTDDEVQDTASAAFLMVVTGDRVHIGNNYGQKWMENCVGACSPLDIERLSLNSYKQKGLSEIR